MRVGEEERGRGGETSASSLNLSSDKASVLIPIRVTPRGHANAITGARNGALLIAVTAPPAEGQANTAVIQVLSDALRHPKSALGIRRGDKARDKVVAVSGLDLGEVRARLEKHLSS